MALRKSKSAFHLDIDNFPPTPSLRSNFFASPCIRKANHVVCSKKSLSIDSPAFTPSTLPIPAVKQPTLSSQTANAAPFTPRSHLSGTVTPNPQAESETTSTFNPATIKEFTPQNYDISHGLGNTTAADASYDPFTMQSINQNLPATPYNPYLEDNTNTMGNNAATTYFGAAPSFNSPAQPLQYHLYAPVGPHRDGLLAYQRTVHDFFIPNELREELSKKMEATLQVMPNSALPSVDHFHSLVALDTNHRENATAFGYPTWVYKALSSKDGRYYVLRRLRGYRLSNERAIRTVKDWKRVDNAGVVSVTECFTTRAFGDSSLIFVYHYHPLSKTLIEEHLTHLNRYGSRASSTIPEQVLWNYLVQIASAIKSIHAAGLAVRCIDPSKIIVTEKNRIRLNACSILDVVQFEASRPLVDLQHEDFALFGRLMLCIATNTASMAAANKLTVDQLARIYSVEFRDTISWLLAPVQTDGIKDINELLRGIAPHISDWLNSSLQANDYQTSILSAELENGRCARLCYKLNVILERPEHQHSEKWAETGERYMLGLFRDYVFHQVDAQGRPVVNLGHIVECMNKLDTGSNQMIKLMTRDEATVMIVSYKEVKKQFQLAFDELIGQMAKTRN